MNRSVLVVLAIVAVLGVVAGCLPGARAQRTVNWAASSLAFEAKFETSGDFYKRFDYGYSGIDPFSAGETGIVRYHGDHNMTCEAPTTLRDVAFGGTPQSLDFSQLFWHCAPGGDPAKGHLMTGVVTSGYNIAWFSPKQAFSQVSKVCWDINETYEGGRKWTQVMFVSAADATRYPTRSVTYKPDIGQARGTGGFDLGFTSPDFRDPNGPTDRIHPQGGSLAGVKLLLNAPSWFQDQDNWTQRYEGPDNVITNITDKAARYTHCLENQPNNVVRLTQATPNGTRTFDMPGQIPQAPVRVVFQDDNYNGPKDADFSPDRITWHWDNILVFTA